MTSREEAGRREDGPGEGPEDTAPPLTPASTAPGAEDRGSHLPVPTNLA